MLGIDELIEKYKNHNIALYGLGTETERFISSYAAYPGNVSDDSNDSNDFRRSGSSNLHITGLLDGFKDSGELYGYPIIPLSTLLDSSVSLIIVIARPGSCKAIAKRIGGFCIDHNIALFDVRGRDLLASTSVSYEFNITSARVDEVNGETAGENSDKENRSAGRSKQALMDSIEAADVISFDLFDTLVMRKVISYTDVFELLNLRLRNAGIYIPDFAKLRLYAEKEMSKDSAPRLVSIYEHVLELVGGSFVTADQLAELEWELDSSLLTVRDAVKDVFRKAVELGKPVIITTDSYYSREQIERILTRFELGDFDNLFVSCEYNTAKTQGLYEEVKKAYPGQSILHIGDDEYADVEKAEEHGLASFRIHSAESLLDLLGGLGLDEAQTISDRIKVGLFLSRIFNSPFWFEKAPQPLSVRSASDIGYLFCAPMITDFIIWMKERTASQGYESILFGARDGYLVGRLYRMIDEGEANDDVIEQMKRLCVKFVKALNGSGLFKQIEGKLPYQVLYDHLDQNVTGIVIEPPLEEEEGIIICEDEVRAEDEFEE